MTTKPETIIKKIARSIREPLDKKKTLRRLAHYHSKERSLDEVVDWALDFKGGGGLYRVKTLQKRSEILSLATLVNKLAPKLILEIGTERGGTLFIWSAIASTKVVSCDLQYMQTQQRLFKRFPPLKSKCEVKLLSGDSHSDSFEKVVREELDGELVDFLFIDGDHSESGVRLDFEKYKKFVRKGGLVAFHDIVEDQPLASNQVQIFWNQVKSDYEFVEFIDQERQCGYGIGVLKV